MSLPISQQTPENPNDLPPARRRQAQRHLVPEDLNGKAQDVDRVAKRTSPSFDFFLFALLAAAIIVAGLLLDAPALLLLGVLAAPTMTPVVGISLGAVTGSFKFFIQRFAATCIACGLVFGVGLVGGYAGRVLAPEQLKFATYHAQIAWPHIFVLAVGTVLSVLAVTREKISPVLPGVALAYELFIPIAVAGFGLGKGVSHLWPDGLVVFATHIALLSLLGMLVFVILGFRPLTFLGYTFGSVITILGVILLIGVSSAGAIIGGEIALPTSSPTPTLTSTPVPPTATFTATPVPPTPTRTSTPTLTPSPTLTSTTAPSATPFYAVINASEESGGAYIRSEPDGEVLTLLSNGNEVEVIDPTPVEANGRDWIKVRLIDGREGWILLNLLAPVSPDPNW